MMNSQKSAKQFSDVIGIAIATARAAAGDYTGAAVQSAKHIKKILLLIGVAFFIILLPIITLLFSVAALDGTSGATNGSDDVDEVVISTGLLGFIERHEGYAATGYRGVDVQNVTIGYGHVVMPGENFTTLTPQQADELLRKDLTLYHVSVNKEFSGCNLTQYQHDALVDFAYGLGAYIWPKASRLVNDIKSGAPPEVLRDDFTAWNVCNGKEIKGLYNRRYDDWRLFVYGDYNADSKNGK